MGHKRIDLTGGQYDSLEHHLSQFLHVKTMLVRKWDTTEDFEAARRLLSFLNSMNKASRDCAIAEFQKQERITLDSLRANILARDPALTLSDNELRSLLNMGHVTLREGNCEPDKAVLIFDPAEDHHTKADPLALSWYFDESSFVNAWYHGDVHKNPAGLSINVKDLVENFDFSPEDRRLYLAVKHTAYALQNQTEYNDRNRIGARNPAHRLLSLSQQGGLHKGCTFKTLDECREDMKIETIMGDYSHLLNFQDPHFLLKLQNARATLNVIYTNVPPKETFARIIEHATLATIEITLQDITDIQERLHQRIRHVLEQHNIHGMTLDWRQIFPAFKAVYDQDTSQGLERQYLNLVMDGLQMFFPTITNAPMPDQTGSEPPRTVQGYKDREAAPKPRPSQPPSPPSPA